MLHDPKPGIQDEDATFCGFIAFLIFSAVSCPDNCFCELCKAECHLTECSDQLFTEVDLLIIYGSLCENHKYIMKHVENGVQFLLKDATCEDIPNCR